MICPVPLSHCLLALVAININWSRSAQAYQGGLQALQEFTPIEPEPNPEEMAAQDGFLDFIDPEMGNDAPYISHLRSDISDAFRFLEEQPMEDSLEQKLLEEEWRRLQSKDKAKRLPLNQHNFIRFGKRVTPSFETGQYAGSLKTGQQENEGKRRFHNFVRIGKQDVQPSVPHWMNNNRQSKGGNVPAQTPADWPSSAFRQLQFHSRRDSTNPVIWGNSRHKLEAANNGRSSLLPITVLNKDQTKIPSSTEEYNKRSPSRFVRFGRSVQMEARSPQNIQTRENLPIRRKRSVKMEEDRVLAHSQDVAKGNDDSVTRLEHPTKRLNPSKGFQTARIGRIPATVFYRPWKEQVDAPVQSDSLLPQVISRAAAFGRQNIHLLPRYG